MIELIQSGDGKAFSYLVGEYQQKVINISFGMLSDYEDACDAAQEVFVKVYRSIDKFRGESSLSTWIYRITKNVCSDFLRKRKETSLSLDEKKEDFPKIEVTDCTYSPEHSAEKGEMKKIIGQAISQLDEKSREVIILYEAEDLSYDEISEILQLPVGTVKSRINRAREKLKKILLPNRELFL